MSDKKTMTIPKRLLLLFVACGLIFTQTAQAYSSLSWQSQSGSGHYNETVKLANIKAGTLRQAQGERSGLSVDATGGVIVDIPEVAAAPAPSGLQAAQLKAPLTDKQTAQAAAEQKVQDAQRLTEHLNTLAKQPGQEWIAQLAKDPKLNVQFKQVSAAAQQWNYSHDGLTPEAAGVIVIVVTYFTAGIASGAAGSVVAGAGATGASAAVASAALAAGMTTLASQASLALINNKGDLGKTLDDMGKSENVKALATAMVTAGVLSQLNQTLNLSNVNAQSGFADQLQKNVINQSSSALINHAINGGDLSKQLEQSLKSAFIDTGAAQGANWIGNLKDQGTLNDYTHKLAHAIAGCAAGAAKSNDCSSGALGAVVGEITAELYAPNNTGTPLTAKQQTDTINFSKMIAGVAAALTGNNVNVAAGAAGNAAENNRLLHMNETNRIAKIAKGAPNKEARLNDAACYIVHCAAQYPEGSQERRYYQSVEARGQANSYELQQLADAQKSDPTLFNYSFSDKGIDLGKKTLDTTLVAAGKVVDLGKGVAIGAGDTIIQTGALALDVAQLAGAGIAGDSASNVEPVSGLGKAIQQNGVIDTVANIPGNTLRGVADAGHAAGQGNLHPLGEIAGAAVVPVVAGKVLGAVKVPTVEVEGGANGGLGKVVGNFSAIEPGPLANNLAETFAGGKYTTVTLESDTILYRAGTADKPLGQSFSLEPPIGILQTRIDKAVLPEWPSGATSPIDTSFAVKIPAGAQVHIGEVGTQNSFYVGGTQQIVVPKPWTIPGVQVISSSPLK